MDPFHRDEAHEAAQGLLKSQLRRRLYAARAEDSKNASWPGLRDLEEGFVRAYKETWRESLSPLNLSDPSIRDELREVVDAAVDAACHSITNHFLDLGLEPDWVESQLEEWKAEFSFGTFIGVPDA